MLFAHVYVLMYVHDFASADSVWRTGYNIVGTPGVNGHTDYLFDNVIDSRKVRYVRFYNTKAATQYGVKIYEMRVFGSEWVATDTEAPVMTSAKLVTAKGTSVVLAVSATDNNEVVAYHV